MSNYPRTVEELDLDTVQFPPAAIAAMRRLARSRPWRGTIEARQRKLLRLLSELSAAYEVATPLVEFDLNGQASDRSGYYPGLAKIVLRGSNMSVISLTHEFYHHVLGESEHAVCRHSLALFRQCFPVSWSRLRFEGHMARART